MEAEIDQLVEMGASRAQARAALIKYQDVMQAAERFFDGEFDNVKEDGTKPASTAPVASGSKPSRMAMQAQAQTSEDEDDDDDMNDGDDDGEEDFVDYDSDGELGILKLADVDPYAGIFFSKDRREEVIEIEEPAEYAVLQNSPERVKLLPQGEWMKGCPEGGEQNFLFGLYRQLTEGVCVCPGCSDHVVARNKSHFFATFNEFPAYIQHVLSLLQQQCPTCSTHFCFACGEQTSGKATGDPLFHCAELQGVLIGVGLYMVEQVINEQNMDVSEAHTPATNKRRKAEDGALEDSSDSMGFISGVVQSLKKPRISSKAPGGTGYAGNLTEDQSGQLQAFAAQRDKDTRLGNLLSEVRTYLPDMKREGGVRKSDSMCHPTTLAHLRRRFCPLLSNMLRNDSLTDMEERSVLYFELFEWLKTVANHESFASMMAQPVMLPVTTSITTKRGSPIREKKITYEGSASPREMLEYIVIQASTAIKGLEGLRPADPNDAEMTEEQKRTTGVGLDTTKVEEDATLSGENLRLLEFCQRIVNTAGFIDRFLRDTKGAQFFERMQASLPSVKSAASAEVTVASGASDAETEKIYFEWANRVRFEYDDLSIPDPGSDAPPHYKHFFNNEARLVVGSDLPRRSLSIAKELAVLTTNLPVSWGSSVFLRVDETRVDIIKVLITGPEGTPYHNGCYLFDVFLGTDYNRSPPRVKYMTTNGGKYRFNPNLYADGKVCLSLLGTWQGPSWVSGKSTLLQVLVSIQAMILCEEPYLNEPGWAESAGTPQSKAYSTNVRRMVVHTAMLDALKNPPEPFADVVRTHFRLKAKSISAQLDDWLSKDDGQQTAGDGATSAHSLGPNGAGKKNASLNNLAQDIQEMKQLLVKLEKGESID